MRRARRQHRDSRGWHRHLGFGGARRSRRTFPSRRAWHCPLRRPLGRRARRRTLDRGWQRRRERRRRPAAPASTTNRRREPPHRRGSDCPCSRHRPPATPTVFGFTVPTAPHRGTSGESDAGGERDDRSKRSREGSSRDLHHTHKGSVSSAPFSPTQSRPRPSLRSDQSSRAPTTATPESGGAAKRRSPSSFPPHPTGRAEYWRYRS